MGLGDAIRKSGKARTFGFDEAISLKVHLIFTWRIWNDTILPTVDLVRIGLLTLETDTLLVTEVPSAFALERRWILRCGNLNET